jgi:hypothetical protein
MEGRVHLVYRSEFPMPLPELGSQITSRVRWLLRKFPHRKPLFAVE